MAFDRELWDDRFSVSAVPAFTCPRCSKGTLQFDKKQFWKVEPKFSVDAHGHEDWDPEWVDERFAMFLKCSAEKCGEIVVVSGSASVEQVYDEEYGPSMESLLVPAMMVPAPPIIRVPERTPQEVQAELQLAFQLFWSDLGASATKIRTSVERLMDHFKVAKFKRTGGKLKPIPLFTRIETFIAKNGKVVHKDHLHALRVVGNLGTHSNAATRSDVLEAFQIYEHALDELIGKKSTVIAKLAKKLKQK
ncbi:DUF4145 domain-containing protein [Bradyrhizobium sp. WSM1417]|uniref:DUF4145 domain-containing protein n=1 Tax=Bradyrhizobium sp. WSM1417 TaxID=754500 RepID=UPI0004857EA2|nr:DUF4145 domain-containing protein [Bradyrhizobium sp. WSM1417]